MLKFENPSNGRYYYLIIEKDILNELVLTVIRGGNYARCVRHYGYNCEQSIAKAIQRLTKLRLRHGYKLTE